VDKLTELTTQKVKGKMAPDFDTFIWGWGGDPYDPSILLGLITTSQIGGSSDSFYSNPEYDKLYAQEAGEFDLDNRKALVKQLVDISQRDLPYLVLTVDPTLQAYRTDRVSNAQRICPKQTGDIICDEVGYTAWLTMGPPVAAVAAKTTNDGGSSGVMIAVIVVAVLVLGLIVLLVVRRRRKSREAIEV
jgi:peptide/nickel transport system substrate-binding protein